MRKRWWAGFVVGTGMLAAAPAFAQTEAPEEFTRDMAGRIGRAVPQLRLAPIGPLQLRVTGAPGHEDLTINLDRVYNYCRQATPADCEISKANFIGATRDMAGMPDTTRREQLRLMVRSTAFCDEARRQYAQATTPSEPVTRPAGPGLCALLVADFPNAMRIASGDTLAELSLGPDQAWTLAARQTVDALGATPELDGLGDAFVFVEGREYVPSLLLDAARWRRLTQAHGEIVVAVPGDGLLVAAKRSHVGDLGQLRTLVREAFESAERGISPLLYRWTESGWVEIR